MKKQSKIGTTPSYKGIHNVNAEGKIYSDNINKDQKNNYLYYQRFGIYFLGFEDLISAYGKLS